MKTQSVPYYLQHTQNWRPSVHKLQTRFCLGGNGNPFLGIPLHVSSNLRFSSSVTLCIFFLNAENSCWCVLFCDLKTHKAACFKWNNHNHWAFLNVYRDLLFLHLRELLFACCNILRSVKTKGLWLVKKKKHDYLPLIQIVVFQMYSVS